MNGSPVSRHSPGAASVKSNSAGWRLGIVLAGAGIWLGMVVVRLYGLQISAHDAFLERAERQQSRVVTLPSARGTIYDAAGRELAVSLEVQSVAAEPSQIVDPRATAEALASVLDQDALRHDVDALTSLLSSDRGFAWVARKLDPPDAERVAKLDLDGIFPVKETRRYYPLRELAAPVLGYVGIDNEGLSGLEFLFEDVVTGEPGRREVVRDARSGTLLRPGLEAHAARPGKDLHLTLDAGVQHIAESELDTAMEKYSAKRGMVVVMAPSTGAILAMASRPTFDPNHFAKSSADAWRNSIVMDAFEPGSTFKMVTLAAALEVQAVNERTEYECEMGGITLHGRRIRDHHPFGRLSVRQILAKSSNVGAIKIGRAAGTKKFYETILAFGFGRPTGIDLPSESAGLLRPLERWQALTPAYVSFGHGVSITALQLVNSFAVIANGGWLVEPYVVAATGHGDDLVRRQPRRTRVPLAPSTLATVRDILTTVVTEGTANAAAIPGYGAAGKTGTAQKVTPGGGYSSNRHIASFAGFAPLDEPAVVAAVILDEPRPLYHGGEVAAPVWGSVVRRTLLALGVPPDASAPDWPPPPATPQGTPPPTLLASAHAPTSDGPEIEVVPDLRGALAREAVRRAAALGLRPVLRGHGAVAHQIPPPGTPLAEAGDHLELNLTLEALRAAALPAARVSLDDARSTTKTSLGGTR